MHQPGGTLSGVVFDVRSERSTLPIFPTRFLGRGDQHESNRIIHGCLFSRDGYQLSTDTSEVSREAIGETDLHHAKTHPFPGKQRKVDFFSTTCIANWVLLDSFQSNGRIKEGGGFVNAPAISALQFRHPPPGPVSKIGW
jgi:hypothetical protein